MIPKNNRIVDKKIIKEIRQIGYCELCGSQFNLQAHHIKSKGAGGHDLPSNLICLCSVCHRIVHDGNISRERLRDVVDRREGYDV